MASAASIDDQESSVCCGSKRQVSLTAAKGSAVLKPVQATQSLIVRSKSVTSSSG
eukprot:IDg4139t1